MTSEKEKEATSPRKPQLVHSARQMFETRWAKYNDPRNLDSEFDADMARAGKWERHAWSAYLDLVATEEERDAAVNERSALQERVKRLEEALTPLVIRPTKMVENGPECDCPAEGHLCGWPALNYELDGARAALTEREVRTDGEKRSTRV